MKKQEKNKGIDVYFEGMKRGAEEMVFDLIKKGIISHKELAKYFATEMMKSNLLLENLFK